MAAGGRRRTPGTLPGCRKVLVLAHRFVVGTAMAHLFPIAVILVNIRNQLLLAARSKQPTRRLSLPAKAVVQQSVGVR